MARITRMAVLFALLLCLTTLCGCSETYPVVRETPGGAVTGVVEKGVECFRGIPYAEPPVGENRWKGPRPVEPWKGNLQCTEFRPVCIQPELSELEGGADTGRASEDCLYLNVWSPVKKGKAALPAMVWIHGGAFMSGSGSTSLYSGARLAKKGVVVVTINYRLGPFGFLAHPALSAESALGTSGNYGLLDQIEALKWVKRNIASFGGDPERVTIFGESAGAFSVGALLLAPRATGLFHRAILQSGAPTSQKYIMPSANGSMAQALATGQRLASRLECDGAGDVARAMRMKTSEEIMAAAHTSPEFIFKDEGLLFAPVIDGSLLPAEPERLLAEGRLVKVPVMVGTNRDEASLFIGDLSPAVYGSWLPANLGAGAGEAASRYPFEEKAGIDSRASRFLSALWFVEPARFLARSVGKSGGKAYLYTFTHVPENGLLREYGAFHGQEVEYVFGNLGTIMPTDYDRALSGTMMDYWVAFAATGDPNSGRLPRWPAYDEKGDLSMEFGATVSLNAGWEKATCDFVEKIRQEGRDRDKDRDRQKRKPPAVERGRDRNRAR